MLEPKETDVLFGRTNICVLHSGTVCLRALLLDHCISMYNVLRSKGDKTRFINAILYTIHSHGGRFLEMKQDESGWKEVDDKKAKGKVSHMLQDIPNLRDFSLINSSFFPLSCFKTENNFLWNVMVVNTVAIQHQMKSSVAAAASASTGATTTAKEALNKPTSLPVDKGKGRDCINDSQEELLHQAVAKNDTRSTMGSDSVSSRRPSLDKVVDWDTVLPNLMGAELSIDNTADNEMGLKPLHRSMSNLSLHSMLSL